MYFIRWYILFEISLRHIHALSRLHLSHFPHMCVCVWINFFIDLTVQARGNKDIEFVNMDGKMNGIWELHNEWSPALSPPSPINFLHHNAYTLTMVEFITFHIYCSWEGIFIFAHYFNFFMFNSHIYILMYGVFVWTGKFLTVFISGLCTAHAHLYLPLMCCFDIHIILSSNVGKYITEWRFFEFKCKKRYSLVQQFFLRLFKQRFPEKFPHLPLFLRFASVVSEGIIRDNTCIARKTCGMEKLEYSFRLKSECSVLCCEDTQFRRSYEYKRYGEKVFLFNLFMRKLFSSGWFM